MRLRDGLELTLLGALWGSSFLFMRMGAPQFGPVALIALRVGLAALLLLPLLLLSEGTGQLRRHAGSLLLLGLINSALPFTLFAYVTLHVTAGFAAVLNSSVPMFGVVVTRLWLREPITPIRSGGLAISLLGVVLLVWDKLGFGPGSLVPVVAAAFLANLCFSLSATYTKKHLAGVSSLTIATGSMLSATLLMLPAAIVLWPAVPPSPRSWLAVCGLAIGCTGLAYIIYFRLIAHIGPYRAMTVAFLIPIFGMLWGALVLLENITVSMLVSCVVILLGTTLTIGVWRPAAWPGWLAKRRPRA